MEFINKKVKVYRSDYNDKAVYSIGASKKNIDGDMEYAYKPVRFRKGVELQNKTEIVIKEGWEDFTNYTNKDGKTKSIWYFFINKFEMATELDAIKQVSEQPPKEKTYLEQSADEETEYPFY